VVLLTAPEKNISLVTVLLQMDWFVTVLTAGVGLIVIVKLREVPAQPFMDGVTVIVPATGVLPEFDAVKALILPVPLAPMPNAELLFVQVKVLPATEPVKVVAPPMEPLHIAIFGTELRSTVGSGLAVIVKLLLAPVQPLATGVTVIVSIIGAVVVFLTKKENILPVPELPDA